MDPAEILRRRLEADATRRLEERRVSRLPGEWGVSGQILSLPTAEDISVTTGNRGRVVHAKRSDPFDLLHAAGGLTDHQHMAARRLFRDYCLRAGVRDHDHLLLEIPIDGGAPALVNDAMCDAGKRIRGYLQAVGPVSAKVLRALIEPMVDQGAIIAWRGTIQRVTGETERHAQGVAVRHACENLRLVMAIGPADADFSIDDEVAL